MKTSSMDVALLVLRLALGLIMVFYGCQKMFGFFGGHGFGGTLDIFSKAFHISPLFGTLAIFGEFFGALGVLSGLLTRIAAFGLACTMATATWVNINADSVQKLWTTGNPADASKIFYPLLLLLCALTILIAGPGSISLDSVLAKRRGKKK